MKVAIVHDWLVTDAGAEKVLEGIIDLYPDADIFSLVDFLSEKDRKTVLHGKYSKTSFIQKLPFSQRYFRNYLPLFPKAIESFNLKNYELIISSSWAVAKGVKTTKQQVHICYCYTPIRYAWDLFDEYTSSLKQPKKMIVKAVLSYIRNWDIKTLSRVDYFIADSKFVQERIKRTYNRKSTVIYPPVNTNAFELEEKKEDYYITASRLVPYKKTKLIVEAFNKIPNKKLLVIGDGEDFEEIKKIAKNNIHILGYQEFNKMVKYMQKSKAFIYAAIEDFGIVPIEAMSCGTPVIALNKGGTAETVENGVTGLHFNEQTTTDIINAISQFEKMSFNPLKVSTKVKSYSKKRFQEEFKSFVNSKIKNKQKD